ncbi:hypothetical protein GCM10011331_23370 [Flavimobilis marinus]|uniref:Glycosyl transferase family 2 n=1 Tax=Flavimobilis marinus TaxID=285351 RepID=A0A1I2GLW0_9MICO|nr:glycosyltransferase family 2 protein [Flavimobilis marinus]GHG56156.1 hypothetical protein GCM10011331_23370 [Flavimobilis marinus]SFF18009.1 Glycosyl transferase family 2 [Flavimobilis marinus]
MSADRGPEISVVMPTKNVALWVEEAVTSVLTQRGVDLEVIVVDDHSDDGTVEVLEMLAQRDSRLRVVRATVRGGGEARNEGVARARGEFLAFADGDDIVPDGVYARLLERLRLSGSDIIAGNYLTFAPSTSWLRQSGLPIYGESRTGVGLRDEPRLLRDRVVWNKIFTMRHWRRSGAHFRNPPRANDVVAMTEAMAEASIDLDPSVTYVYRRRPGGGSMTSAAKREDALLAYFQQESLCLTILAERSEHTVVHYFLTMLFETDGWAALKGYFSGRTVSRADAGAFAELARVIAAAVERCPHWVWRKIPLDKRMVYALLASARADLLYLVWDDVHPPHTADRRDDATQLAKLLRHEPGGDTVLRQVWREEFLGQFSRAANATDRDLAADTVAFREAYVSLTDLTRAERMILGRLEAGDLDGARLLSVQCARTSAVLRRAADVGGGTRVVVEVSSSGSLSAEWNTGRLIARGQAGRSATVKRDSPKPAARIVNGWKRRDRYIVEGVAPRDLDDYRLTVEMVVDQRLRPLPIRVAPLVAPGPS